MPCTINGLPLHFVFDTGASDVSLSSVEAQFMFKNGYLKPSDVIGRRAYLTASGDVVEGTSVRLHSVTFGGLTLNNVRASITTVRPLRSSSASPCSADWAKWKSTTRPT